MSQKQIEIRIYKDGTIKSRTKNMKGKACMKYLQVIEEICGARVIDSDFTAEYYESEQAVRTEQIAEIEQPILECAKETL